ncbi:MAG: magnesium transporter [Myxococcota bacterium]
MRMDVTRARPTDETPAWESLGQLLAGDDAEAVRTFVVGLSPSDTPRLVTRLRGEERAKLLSVLDPGAAAALLEQLPDVQIAELLADVAPPVAALIVNVLPSNQQADVLTALSSDAARAVLRLMQPDEAADATRLVRYPERTAGGIMITEYLSFPEDATVAEVLDDLRANTERYQRHDVQYIYVTDAAGVLNGVLRLRDLVLTAASTKVRQIMITALECVPVDASLAALQDFFARLPYRGVPVVDPRHQLVGVVRHVDVAEALGEQATSDHLKARGIVGGEELRTMPVLTRARRRLSWLAINIGLNIVAASIIALYQETLATVIALAVFLPIVSDMSGCSGNQAIAVSMRELALGMVRPADAWRVWTQELSVGVINALALGLLLGLAAFVWQGNVMLSLVVGVALALNTVVAVSLGGLIPLVLRALRMDPALASGPILTTVTDMCGFFFVLSFASATLPALALG